MPPGAYRSTLSPLPRESKGSIHAPLSNESPTPRSMSTGEPSGLSAPGCSSCSASARTTPKRRSTSCGAKSRRCASSKTRQARRTFARRCVGRGACLSQFTFMPAARREIDLFHRRGRACRSESPLRALRLASSQGRASRGNGRIWRDDGGGSLVNDGPFSPSGSTPTSYKKGNPSPTHAESARRCQSAHCQHDIALESLRSSATLRQGAHRPTAAPRSPQRLAPGVGFELQGCGPVAAERALSSASLQLLQHVIFT